MELEKITKTVEARRHRRYEDACGAAHAMDLLGERWALFVMRELMLGPLRFSDLRARLPGISANVLTQRLEGLEAAGVIGRRRLAPPAASRVYELTEWGYESEPIFRALGRWAARSPLHDPTLPFSAASLMLSLRTMFAPERAGGLDMTAAFRLGEANLIGRASDGRLEIGPCALGDAVGDVVFSGEARSVAAFFYGGAPLSALESQGILAVAGDRALAERFAALFPLPEKVTPPAGR